MYDDLYNTNNFKSEHFNTSKILKENKESKYKEVIESSKSKFTSSPNYHRNNLILQ